MGRLKCAYVMMESDYTHNSTPKSVDGWLGLMLAGALWYPLWDEKFVAKTAEELSTSLFLDAGKKISNDQVISLGPQMPKVNVPASISLWFPSYINF